jgi:hypothetical protein
LASLLSSFGRASKPDFAKIEQVISRAEQTKSAGWKYAMALCDKLGFHPDSSIHMGPIKDPQRIAEKAAARYQGDVEKVGDVCRLYITLNTLDDVARVQAVLFPGRNDPFHKSWDKKGISLVEVKDNFTHPTTTGWIGFNCKLQADLGKGRKQMFEVQIIPEQMTDVYETTHTYLENKRKIQDTAAAQHRLLSPDEEKQLANYSEMAKGRHEAVAKEFGFFSLRKEYAPPVIRHRDFVP